MVDLAFKKRPGSKKIRYVELKENRETSMNSSEFSLAKKPQIASLKKSGMKYVPYKRQTINNNIGERRGRENNLLNKIKPLASVKKDSEKSRSSKSTKRLKEVDDPVRLGGHKIVTSKGTNSSRSYISWQGLLFFIFLMIVAGVMMFPSRKI